jgi:hypothetical protein
MDAKIAEQILDELAPAFEALESQSAAILQFLKDKNIADDDQLAPYMEKAAAASSVRWRALRVRMGRLFALAEKSEEEKQAKKEAEKEGEGGSKRGGQSASEQAPEPWNKELVNRAEQSPSGTDEASAPRGEEREPVNEDKRGKAAHEKIARKPVDSGSQKTKEPTAQADNQNSTEHKDKNAA